MAFKYVFNRENYRTDKAKAKIDYESWQRCKTCSRQFAKKMAADKTLHRQFETFSSLDATEQRRRAKLGLFEDFPDELK